MTTFGDQLFHLGGVPVALNGMGKAMPQKSYFVDGNNGSNGNTGLTPDDAFLTIQHAIDVVNVAANITIDCDILVMGGYYTETLWFKHTHMGTEELLWTNGGSNIGLVGKIRMIAMGNAFIEGGTSAVVPTITIDRPNVEIHDFEMIYLTTTETVTSGNWTLPSTGTVSGYAMPCVYTGDDYNYPDGSREYSAGNKVLINNCRINAGTGDIAVMSHGAKHVYVTNCIIEYAGDYGIAMIGSSKGAGAECKIAHCVFNQNDTDIYFQAQVTNFIHDCLFMNDGATDHFAGGSGCSYNWIDNCAGLSEDLFEAAGSSGIDATRIYTSTDGGPAGSTNLTTDTWRADLTSTHGNTSG